MHMRLSKIVATIGPRSEDTDTLSKLILAGVNVLRLNFSHGGPEKFEPLISRIVALRKELGSPVAILGDIQGPKFRVGELVDHQPVELINGQTIELAVGKDIGSAKRVFTVFDQLVSGLTVGQRVLLDDGAMELEVVEAKGKDVVTCLIKKGGLLKEKKGINVPGLMVDIPPLTAKDKIDCEFAMTQPFDFLALSFVQSDKDIRYLREFLVSHNPQDRLLPAIVAKIENPQSLNHLDGILADADAIMVARGDMGVEMPIEKVPFVQKQLIHESNLTERPVITATQMLESMVKSPVPTRAEVTDIANAIFDGSDAVMLSAETAAGDYPIETVEYMARVMREAERNLPYWHRPDDFERVFRDPSETPYSDGMEYHEAIAQTAVIAARRSDAKAIMVISNSGSMATRVSKRKPRCPIIMLTTSDSAYYRSNLLWGIYPIKISPTAEDYDVFSSVSREIQDLGIVDMQDTIVVCAGKTRLSGLTNTLKIQKLEQLFSISAPEPSTSHEFISKQPEVPTYN